MTDTAQVISAKTLVWKTSASSNVQYFLLVLNLQDYVNLNQVENYLKERIRLASKEQAEILTKQKIGSILPFLPSSREKVPGLRVLIDEKLVEHPDCIVRFIHTTQQSTKSNVSSSLADDAGGKMIIEISALELVRITDGEIVSLSSNSPIRSDFLEEQSIGRNFSKSMKPTHKNDSDDSIMYFSPSQLRKIAMTSDYAKMVQVLSALRHQQFHSSYSFPNYFTMSDHVNVASRSGGKTAIQLACWKGSLPIIQLLLQFGANLNQYSTNEHNYGKTAIFYAITQCRDDVVLYLLKDHSPNLLIVNNKGQTPLSLAITHLSEETIRIVEEKEKLLEESKQYEWMNFYDSEHRGRGVFGDLDPRFISRSHCREIVDTLLTIRSKRDEKDLLQPNEAEDGDRLSSLAISRILMSTEDDTRSFFLETDELEARSEETKFARIVPIFPTTLETRRNIRSVYMIQQLQGQLESNTSKLIADQQSTSSAPGRSKSQKFLRHKALEEEKLILQEFSGDVLPSAHHDSNIIDIHHRGHMTLKGIITAKRQLSNKLVFLNISPNQSLLNSSTPHFTASQLRYSWRTADAGLVETKNYYAIQLIVGKTFRSNLEDLYQQKETTSSTTNAGNGTVMMEKVCKIMKVGHVIEIDGEIKSVQERTNPILPSTGLYSSKTLGGDVEAKEEKYFEVEMIVHRLRFIGAEIVPTLPDLIDKVPDLGNSSPTANISLITSKNEAKQKKMKSEKIESGSPLVKTQTVETEYVNLKDLTFFVDHFANPSLEKYIYTKDPVYLLDWNHSNDIQHFISIMRTTFDYLQHSPSSVDSSMSLSIDPRQLIGIDCEWKPEHYDLINSKNADTENSLKEKSDIQQLEQNLDKISTRNKKENRNAFLRINPVEIMQISTIYGVFLFDMRRLFPATDEYHTNHDEEVKEDLRKVLLSLFEHQRLYKIGFELHQDLERLFSSYHWLFFPSESSNELNLNFSIKSIIDINSLTKVMVSSLRGFHKQHRWSGLSKSDYTSLSKLTKLLFNFEKTLNKEQQCSAWHERPLSEAQIEYAALDAAILIELFQRLTAEILEVHSHHTVHGFLQKQNLIINLKFQLFTHQAILESYYDYFGLIDESFTKTRPRHHILFEEPHGTRKRILLIHEKCSSNQHHTETNSLSNHPWLFYKKNRPRTRSRSFESKDGSEHETTEKCKESITVLPIEDSPEGEEFRKAFIGKMVGKSKDYCLKLFEQWYYSHQTSVGLISKQSGFYVVNQRHIVIFINLLSPSAKFQATSYDNIFFDKGKYFNFYVLRKQLEQFSPVNSDGGMLNQNDFQDLLKGSPKREFHLFLRPEGMRAFFYSGKCRLIPPSDLLDSLMQMKEDEGRKTIDGNSRLSKGVTSTISESLFKEFFLELTDHDDYLAQNFEFETMIEHHSLLQRVRFERK